ncbi:hypothetical protein DFS34DRAFT_287664 [Phlyctochytrium arcticum]|nr:hypothetical protein DFS34DRAFT_287664 [Phlyctochytrium arcticum]
MDELDKLLLDLQGALPAAAKPVENQPLLPAQTHNTPAPSNDDDQPKSFTISSTHSRPSGIADSVNPCFACGLAIQGPSIIALGNRSFHRECFRCCVKTCQRRLAGMPYLEKIPDIYCESCYHIQFAEKCAYCEEPITNRCIQALGKAFHPEHFFCCQCGKNFDIDETFMECDGRAYCSEDYSALFATGCSACQKALVTDYITAAGGKFHFECFNCHLCSKPLASEGFFEHNGHVYCERDYHAVTARACATCGQPLLGRVIKACGKTYHHDCFQCAYCKELLETPKSWGASGEGEQKDTTFRQFQGDPFCQKCFVKLYL